MEIRDVRGIYQQAQKNVMRYIADLRDGDNVDGTFLVRKITPGTTKTGKSYETLLLQDKTGSVDAKIWDPNSMGISEFDVLDYVNIKGEVTSFNNALQVNVKRLMVAPEGTYDPADYLPCSKRDVEEMYRELLALMDTIKTPHFRKLLHMFFVEDKDFIKKFKFSSAAKSVHHGFVGGLLEHTLSVAENCEYFAEHYGFLDRDLLITAAICHDIGKVEELSPYPENDYTDDGQLIGHIIIGAQMIKDAVRQIPEFPEIKARELEHCILAHHGELEFGSPKKPALAEAIALSFADNLDAKLETMKEALETANGTDWQGFNKFLDSNIRKTCDVR